VVSFIGGGNHRRAEKNKEQKTKKTKIRNNKN
jgi:hypothetical protein